VNDKPQTVVLNGWRGNVLSGVILIAIGSGATGLAIAAKLAFAQDAMQADVAQVKAKVDKLWEDGIRGEAINREIQKDHEQQAQIEKKLDALLVKQGIDTDRAVYEDR